MNKLVKQAFTLIELLVVIAIIGILSGLIVVSMGGMTTKATIAKSQIFSNSLRNSLMATIVGEWKFDGTATDGTAVSTNDTSDTWANYDCSISGNLTVRTGNNCIFGSCMEDANSGYLACGDLGIAAGEAATIEGWFYPHTTAKTRGQNMAYFYPLYQHVANDFFYFTGGYFAATPELNKWTYIVLTYSGPANTGLVYLNDQKVNVSIQSGNPFAAIANFFIGGNFSYGFDGLIDNVRVYKSVIPASKIKENYYAGLNSLLASGNIDAREYSERINSIALQ